MTFRTMTNKGFSAYDTIDRYLAWPIKSASFSYIKIKAPAAGNGGSSLQRSRAGALHAGIHMSKTILLISQDILEHKHKARYDHYGYHN